jgi:hypothetical protein
MDLIKPKDFTATTLDGAEKTYVLSRIPAVACREIVAKYPMSALPKLGDYAVNEETMLKLMSYVGVTLADGNVQPLKTRALVDSHCPDWEILFAVERAMLAYNTSFFSHGTISSLLDDLGQSAKRWISSTLTDLLAASSKPTKQP